MLRVGLISDTHGLLRPEALEFLRGSAHIVHAGDIGNGSIVETLAGLAPLTAVRGNNDTGGWAQDLPETTSIQLGAIRIQVVHALADLRLDGAAPPVRVVICGHSHKPTVERRGELLLVNPGSAGPRRFHLPVTAAELLIDGTRVHARIADLLSPG